MELFLGFLFISVLGIVVVFDLYCTILSHVYGMENCPLWYINEDFQMTSVYWVKILFLTLIGSLEVIVSIRVLRSVWRIEGVEKSKAGSSRAASSTQNSLGKSLTSGALVSAYKRVTSGTSNKINPTELESKEIEKKVSLDHSNTIKATPSSTEHLTTENKSPIAETKTGDNNKVVTTGNRVISSKVNFIPKASNDSSLYLERVATKLRFISKLMILSGLSMLCSVGLFFFYYYSGSSNINPYFEFCTYQFPYILIQLSSVLEVECVNRCITKVNKVVKT